MLTLVAVWRWWLEQPRREPPREELVGESRQAGRERGPNGRSRGRKSERVRAQQREGCGEGV